MRWVRQLSGTCERSQPGEQSMYISKQWDENLASKKDGVGFGAYPFYFICRRGRSLLEDEGSSSQYWPCAHTWNNALGTWDQP
jgi:hypothetical protein